LKPSGIGGQAVMEGIMMKYHSKYAVAVRKADGSIDTTTYTYYSLSERLEFLKFPFLRGIINFLESLYLGMKTLLYSYSFIEEQEEREKQEWQEWISTGTGRNFTEKEHSFSPVVAWIKRVISKAVLVLLMLCAFAIAIGLFVFLPMFLSECILGASHLTGKAALEGVLRLIVFLLYIFAISGMKDIRRVFMYHGAEHKSINCIENELPLTVENMQGQPRQHKRCGTSFLFLVVCFSILFFMLIQTEVFWQKVLFRLILIPVIASVAYECIYLAGQGNRVMEILTCPGMWIQNLTTREPDQEMMEVAIQAVEAVFDWKAFLEREDDMMGEGKDSLVDALEETAASEELPEQRKEVHEQEAQEEKLQGQEPHKEEPQNGTLSMRTKQRILHSIKNDEYSNREEQKEDRKNPSVSAEDDLLLKDEEEDDPILSALDRYFDQT